MTEMITINVWDLKNKLYGVQGKIADIIFDNSRHEIAYYELEALLQDIASDVRSIINDLGGAIDDGK